MPNYKMPMKMYGKGKNPITMTEAQKTLPEELQAGIRAKEEKEAPTKFLNFNFGGSQDNSRTKIKDKMKTTGNKRFSAIARLFGGRKGSID